MKLRKEETDLKKRILRISAEVLILLMAIIVFVLVNDQITQNRKKRINKIEDSYLYAYQVESISINDNDLVLDGWFVELESVRNQSIIVDKDNKLGVLLYNTNNNQENDKSIVEGLCMDVSYSDRPDVNEYLKCEYDYSHCGFKASINLDQIDLEKGQYQIVFKPDNDSLNGVMSDTYVNKGKLQFVNSEDYIELDVSGTSLEKVVNNGIYVAGCKDYSVCIYQYDSSLYWIVSTESMRNNDYGVQWAIDTTQYGKISPERIEKGQYWEEYSDSFTDYEITDDSYCDKYRVYKRELPKDFSITIMYTGFWNNTERIWLRYFRPVYNSEE